MRYPPSPLFSVPCRSLVVFCCSLVCLVLPKGISFLLQGIPGMRFFQHPQEVPVWDYLMLVKVSARWWVLVACSVFFGLCCPGSMLSLVTVPTGLCKLPAGAVLPDGPQRPGQPRHECRNNPGTWRSSSAALVWKFSAGPVPQGNRICL